ncbi:MAG TPA: hypothetical protein VF945_15970, partial [Polyangia bacterium]
MSESSKGGKSDDSLDDWAAAIDEWDANLALPSPNAPPPKSEAAGQGVPVPDDAKVRERSATPAVGVPELRKRT